jgi:PAS domain S-box-containing protein
MLSKKLLIVEDDPVSLVSLTGMIKKSGFPSPATAASGEDAVAIAEKIRPDLILMDITLPGDLDGISACRLIQEFHDCPVIYITASDDEDTARRAIMTGPYGYIIKPFSIRDLKNSIDMALYKHDLETRLRRSEARYRVIVEEMPHYIFRIIPEGDVITYINRNLTSYLNITEQAALGKNYRDILPDRVASAVEHAISSTTVHNPIVRSDLKLQSGEKPVWHRWMVQAVTGRSGAVMEYQAIGEDITEIKNLQTEIIRVSESEMQRIGRDLHDELGQKLTYMGFLAQMAKKDLQKKGCEDVSELDTIVDLVDDSAKHIRRIYKGLIPVMIEPEGFIYALKEHILVTRQVFNTGIELSIPDNLVFNDSLTATNLYYIVHEAVNNAVKHGRPDLISIKISSDERSLEIEIINTGSHPAEKTKDQQGMGLKIMKYRAGIIGADIETGSVENGFRVRITIEKQ